MENTGQPEDKATLTALHHLRESQHTTGAATLHTLARRNGWYLREGNKHDRRRCHIPVCT